MSRDDEDREDSMPYEWVIQHIKGERAQDVKGLVDNGVGYFLRNETAGRGNSYEIEVAFRRVAVEPRPDNLIPASPQQIHILEGLYAQRHRLHEQQPDRASSGSAGSSAVGDLIRKIGWRAYVQQIQAKKRAKDGGDSSKNAI